MISQSRTQSSFCDAFGSTGFWICEFSSQKCVYECVRVRVRVIVCVCTCEMTVTETTAISWTPSTCESTCVCPRVCVCVCGRGAWWSYLVSRGRRRAQRGMGGKGREGTSLSDDGKSNVKRIKDEIFCYTY